MNIFSQADGSFIAGTPSIVENVGFPTTLPKKTPFQVFVAKYSYDPDQFSPNDHPEAELALNAADYVFVYGEMDEV